jgi:leucyl aminopeptidase
MRSLKLAFATGVFCLGTFVTAEDVWITIGTDGYQSLTQHHPSIAKNFSPTFATLQSEQSDVTILKVQEKDLSSISKMMHHEHNRCGGFIVHDSLAAAQNDLANASSLMTTNSLIAYSIDNGVVAENLKNALTEPGIRDTINSLTSYTNRYYTTASGAAAAQWLKEDWAQKSAGRSDISVELFPHTWAQSSVVMTIQGRTKPNEIVVLGAHLDSIVSGSMSEGTLAPGADDDASGIGTLTELINAITSTGFKPNRTIALMGYAAEEVGLRGSKAIAQNYKDNGKNVVGVLQLDMTNYQGSTGDIYIIDDYTNAAQNTFLKQLLSTYQPSLNVSTSTCGYACSDHASWTNQGYAASFPFEATFNGSNPHIHSAQDTLDKSGNNAFHALKFGQLAATYVAELAKGNMSDTPDPDPEPGTEKTDTFTGAVTKNQQQVFGPINALSSTTVTINMTGSNDADLYVRIGQTPTTSQYDCRPYKSGSAESCTLQIGSTDSEVYIMVRGYSSASSNFNIDATYTPAGTGGPVTEPTVDVKTGSVTKNQENVFGPFPIKTATNFTANMTGTNDADLYVNFDSEPTTSIYECRPYKNGSTESCELTVPLGASNAYVMVRGYSSQASSYEVTMTYVSP